MVSHRFERRQDVEMMRVVHDTQEVAEWVDHCGRDEAMATVSRSLQLHGAHTDGSVELGVDVIDVPVDDTAARPLLLSTLRVMVTLAPRPGLLIDHDAQHIGRSIPAAR